MVGRAPQLRILIQTLGRTDVAVGQSRARVRVQTFETGRESKSYEPTRPLAFHQRRQSDAVRYSDARISARVRGKCPGVLHARRAAGQRCAPVSARARRQRSPPDRVHIHRWTPRRRGLEEGDPDHRAPAAASRGRRRSHARDRGPHPVRRRGALRGRADERADGRRRHPRAARSARPAARVQRQQRLVQLAHHRQARHRPRSLPQPSRRDLVRDQPAGVRGDQFNGDPSWDPVWEGEARTDATGWTAELRIPYSQLRFSRDSVADVGAAGCGASSTGSTSRTCGRSGSSTRAAGPASSATCRGSSSTTGRGRRSCCRTSSRRASSSTRRRATRTTTRAT